MLVYLRGLIIAFHILETFANVIGQDSIVHKKLINSRTGTIESSIEDRFPFLKSNCVKDALTELMPVCLKHGFDEVSSELKVRTAVDLSLCELKESGIENIPRACEIPKGSDTLNCLISLESYPQWWTTYSGNFQRLSSLCFEYSLPFEKEQILQLFLNVTNLFTDINANIMEEFDDLMTETKTNSKLFKNDIYNLFDDLEGMFDEIVTEIRLQNITNEIQQFKQENIKIWKGMEKEAMDYLKKQRIYQDHRLEDIDDYLSEIKYKVGVQSEEIASIAISSMLNIWKEELDIEFLNIKNNLNSTMTELDTINAKVLDFSKQINSISRIFRKIFSVVIFIPKYLTTMNLNNLWISLATIVIIFINIKTLSWITRLPFRIPFKYKHLKLCFVMISISIIGTKVGSSII